MKHYHRQRKAKTGAPPGSLVYMGEEGSGETFLEVVRFSQESYRLEHLPWKQGEPLPRALPGQVTWVNLENLGDPTVMEAAGQDYGIHSLILEDVMNTEHRPKFEDHDDYLAVILPVIRSEGTGHFRQDNLALVLKEGLLLSFWEGGSDYFQPVRERLRNPKRRIRKMGAGFLLYALVDLVVDHYMGVLEEIGEKVTGYQERLFREEWTSLPPEVGWFRSELLGIRKNLRPVKELISGLRRNDSEFLEEGVGPFLGDVHDHIVSVVESLDTNLEMIRNMIDFHLSMNGRRLNETIKFLTIISTIFIPIGFIAGFYGMNFKAMPELEWEYGYPAAIGLMAATAGGLLLYFRKKRWI